MPELEFTRRARNLATAAVVAALTSGCLLQDKVEETPTAEAIDNQISGSVGDGPVVGAAMRILRNDGELLAELESDGSASFNVTIKTRGKYYPLTIDATAGIDLVTGTTPDFDLLGAVFEPGNRSTANLNPFSTLAIVLANAMPDGPTKTNLEAAQAIIVANAGSGLAELAGTGPMKSDIDRTNVAEIVKSSEALGEVLRRTRNWLRIAGFGVDGNQTVSFIGADLLDEVIDGAGGPGANRHAGALANIVAVQVYLESAANELRVNGADAGPALDSALRQIGFGDASPSLAELTVTAQMVEQIGKGLAAGVAVSGDPGLAALRQAVSGLRPGLQPAVVRSLLPDDYREVLDRLLSLLASADVETIDTINDVVRSGGTDVGQNSMPEIAGTPPPMVEAGSLYRFAPTIRDADGDPLSIIVRNLPGWAQFDPVTGAISGIPAESDVGEHPGITIVASDGTASAELGPFTITVTSALGNVAPVIAGQPPTEVLVGEYYSFTPQASDADGDPLTFVVTGRPPWLAFDPGSGELAGTPAAIDVGIHGNIVVGVTDGTATTNLAPFAVTVVAPVVNSPPTLAGTPPTSASVNELYRFVPEAFDADGDSLTFDIAGQPGWAAFSRTTGGLSGTPGDSDAGTYGGIVITVSDGQDSATIGPFSITVSAANLGSATLRWSAPQQNTDGTALTNLAGYRIYWGTTAGSYPNSVTIDNPGVTSYVIENLAPGTYEFVSTAFNFDGVESDFSNPVTKTVTAP